jgi:diguanylate cyclase (GGDEF)-like protein
MISTVTLSSLEQFIASRKSRLPTELRLAFEKDRHRILADSAGAIITRMVIGYNALLPVDIFLAPRTLWFSIGLHLCVVTPYMIMVGLLIWRRPGPLVSEGLSALFPLLMVTQGMIIYRLNCYGPDAADAFQYQYVALAAIIYTNLSQSLNMRVTIITTAITSVIYLGVLLTSPAPFAVKFIGVTALIVISAMALEAKSRLEYNAKQNFLRRLRDRLQRFEAENEASRDALTGLSNRRHFEERAAAIWAARQPALEPVAIIMIDIDHFKLFNDHYGHPTGDHCIKRVGSAIAAALRGQQDLAVRFGGEEFVLLLPGTVLEHAVMIAERIRRAVESMSIPHTASQTSPVVTISLGVTAGPTATRVETLLTNADEALYKAKRAGRNQVHPPFMTLEPTPTRSWRAVG